MGFEKANQVLADGLMRELEDSRKLVLFSDNRMDAAKLSAGLELSHYRDLVRQLLYRAMAANTDRARDAELFEAFLRGDHSEENRLGRDRLRASSLEDTVVVADLLRGEIDEPAESQGAL